MNTLVGHGTVFEGHLNVSSSMRVDGKIIGQITCSDSLLVGKTGVVEASVKVKNATIGGRVVGDIEASEVVILEGNSAVIGDVTTKKLIIEEGAVFNGTCHMSDEVPPKAKKVETGRNEQASPPLAMSSEPPRG
ncbi:MAG: polymer-forming cytoskeletal protein [Candidatus Latescibacteria bacterium]|jgi:cytoskeletal protein CcmA (bactofilin family)|nr:polymer-forming cytoskeletal protein [Candidatus Latescibacterota bacterium]